MPMPHTVTVRLPSVPNNSFALPPKLIVSERENNVGSVTVLGLIGGVASGKSVVATRFHELGASVIDGDHLGHQVLTQPEIVRQLQQHWGDSVIGSEGQVIRRAVGKRVFSDPHELAYLESLTHPQIGRMIRHQIEETRDACERDQTRRVIILDAAILLKTGWDAFCDLILFVEADKKTRKHRALQRGWTAENFARRENSQISIQEKRRRSDIVIDNGGGLEQTCDQVLKVWNSLSV